MKNSDKKRKASEKRNSRKKHDHVIIIGFGLNGRNLAKTLREADIPYVVSEMNNDTVREMRKKGEPIYYGYGTSKEILHKMGIEKAIELRYEGISTKTAVVQYCLNAVIVIVAATFLPKIGEGIAETTGLGQTFVGNIFIAVSTSLPEVVVSFTSVKMDAVDLAIGNLFGSNIFNIFILALDDIFFIKGPILSFANQNHIISAMSAVAMTAIAVIGLTYRSMKKPLFMAWDSIGITIIYIVNLMLLYMLK